ncbi:DNA polymerase III subunit chi [Spiribacter sp. 2438]|uniref:DNA polymerase III subunit chi n=1 Tax=Spiribacter sp. 2438 TaxID=2666185 RepID=UPI0012B0902C|nr:DNA polymerase III subunit chi [Spiribacter sp. 2438]QGM21269.1 DNA polymerase III subunit chi [Spiribacter sp. 2438]
MMPRIDFYILASEGADAREQFCCRLAARAWRKGLTVLIRPQDEAMAVRLDEALWTFDEQSFVPHGREPLGGDNPVVITTEACPGRLLINLSEDTPADWAQRERIAEIINADARIRDTGRQRYRHYQQAGAELKSHRLEH